MYDKDDFFTYLLKGFVVFLLITLCIVTIYLTVNAAFYLKKTYLTYPDSSVAKLEMRTMNQEQRIRAIERWIIRNSKKR